VREGAAVYSASLGRDHLWTSLANCQLAACWFALGRTRRASDLVESQLGFLERLASAPVPVQLGLKRNAEYFSEVGQLGLAARFTTVFERTKAAASQAREAAGGS
jgi:hypothetical protein